MLDAVRPHTSGSRNETLEGKPFSLWLLNNGYNLIGLVIIGLILGAWM